MVCKNFEVEKLRRFQMTITKVFLQKIIIIMCYTINLLSLPSLREVSEANMHVYIYIERL